MAFKRDFLSFSPHLYPSFSHTYLRFSLPYLSYRRVVVRVFLGDQSVGPEAFHSSFDDD